MRDLLTSLMLLALLAVPTVACWRGLRSVVERNTPLFPAAGSSSRVPLTALLAVLGWSGLMLGNRWLADSAQPREITLTALQFSCAVSLMVSSLFALLLTEGGHSPLRAVGVFAEQWPRQAYVGGLAYLAAIWPTGMLLIATRFWRTAETQHPLLQALEDGFSGELLAWIALSVVVVAPLTEELMFRVTLQGWLSERLPGPAAIGLTALSFALVHGWRDALPLLPLSLILGHVFQRTRSYGACVATHGLFNATFIILAVLTRDAASGGE